jgi:hypothetical protein
MQTGFNYLLLAVLVATAICWASLKFSTHAVDVFTLGAVASIAVVGRTVNKSWIGVGPVASMLIIALIAHGANAGWMSEKVRWSGFVLVAFAGAVWASWRFQMLSAPMVPTLSLSGMFAAPKEHPSLQRHDMVAAVLFASLLPGLFMGVVTAFASHAYVVWLCAPIIVFFASVWCVQRRFRRFQRSVTEQQATTDGMAVGVPAPAR